MRPLSSLKGQKSKASLGVLVAILALGGLLSMSASGGIDHTISSIPNVPESRSFNYHLIESKHPGIADKQSALNSNDFGKKSLFPDDADISFQAAEFFKMPGTSISRIDFNNNLSLINVRLTYLSSDIPPPSAYS